MVEIGNIGTGMTVPVDPGFLVLKEVTLKTVTCYEPWALGAAVTFLDRNQEKLPFNRILSHKFPFAEINKAFERADRGEVVRATLMMEN
jgi:Zn-dependent alcohol dehydrogenase